MMRTLLTPLTAVAVLSLLLGGCAVSGSPGWDAQFGDSARALAAQQVLDPGAPARNAQNRGRVDGRTGREAMERHTDTYRAPPTPTIVNTAGER